MPPPPSALPPSLEAGIRRQGVECVSGAGRLCLLPRWQPAGPAQHVAGGAQPVAGETDRARRTVMWPAAVRLSTVAAWLSPSTCKTCNQLIQRSNGSLQDPGVLQVDLMTSGVSSLQT